MTRPNPNPDPDADATAAVPASASRATGTEPDTSAAGPKAGADGNPVPARVGGYVVLGELGRGGMGVVYRAEDPALRREVALKVLLPPLAANPQAKARFVREARAQARVEHDHVAAIHHVHEHAGVPYLVMPLLKGMTLAAALKANPRPPLPEVLRIGREIAEGLAAAHDQGLVHRDIKPGNVWLEGKKLRVKVLDFGLARPAAEDPAGTDTDTGPVTREGAIVGTPAYMSPEQGAGRPVDARTDLWSLGVVLYQMTTGELPFRGPTPMATLIASATESPPPPAGKNPAVPPALSDLVMRLLAKKPGGRPPTGEAVAEELRAIEAALAGAVRVVPLDALPPLVLTPEGPDPFADLDATEAATASRTAERPALRARPKSGGGFPLWAAVVGLLVVVAGIVWVVAQKLGNKPTPEVVKEDEPPRKDVKPNPTPQPPKPKAAIDPHRRLAGWALGAAPPGEVTVALKNHPAAKSAADLPKEPFEVAYITMPLVDSLARGPDPFADVTPLPVLSLTGDWSGERVEQLAARLAGKPFPAVGVRLHVAPQTGRTLAALARVEAVTSLDLFNFTALTPADVTGLKALPSLHTLRLSGPAVTDEAIAPLAGFPTLRYAILDGSPKVTAAGVANLAAAAPWLKIASDHGTTEPKPPPPLTPAEAKQTQAAEAKRLGLPVEAENDIGMRLALVPPGRFLMGSPAPEAGRRENEGPRHEAAITRAFYAGAHEVTQEQYKAVTGADPAVTKGPRRPVENVSWADAAEFCRKLSGRPAELRAGRVYRLPTEAEWEYACRAGAQTVFHFGDDPAETELPKYAWYAPHDQGLTHPVGALLPNPWGLYDTHGNVWELCSDFYRADYYHVSPRLDPRGPAAGTTYVIRGGARANPSTEARSANRWPDWGGEPFQNVGFRVACEVRTPEYAVARYFLDRAPFVPGTGGFTLTLRRPDGTEVVVNAAADLPAGPFTLVALTRNGPTPPAFTDADLARLEVTPTLTGFSAPTLGITTAGLRSLLASRKTLGNLYLGGSPLTDEHLEVVAGFTELTGLHVGAVGSKVTDAGVAHLGGLTKLRSLVLHDAGLTDAGLKALAALPALTGLELANTAVSDAGVETLAGMTGLAELGLTGTRVTEAGFKKLQAALPKCKITWEDPNRHAATHLVAAPGYVLTLRLPDGKEVRAAQADQIPAGAFTVVGVSKPNPATPFGDADLRRLGALPALENLSIIGHQLTTEGLRELSPHRKALRGLWVTHGPVTDAGAKVIAERTDVTTLGLASTRVTDAGLVHLARLSDLESLGIPQTAVTDAGLKHLAGFKRLALLYVNDTAVSDAGVETLAGMKSLRALWLGGTPVTEAGLRKLQAVLPACKIDWQEPGRAIPRAFLARGGFTFALRLPDGKTVLVSRPDDLPPGPFAVFNVTPAVGAPFADPDLRRLAALPGLTHLGLDGHQLTDAGLAALLTWKDSLLLLVLRDGPVTDAGLRRVAALHALTHLRLDGTLVSDTGVESLAGLKGLIELDLRGTRVTDAGVKKLQAALPNCKIDWEEPNRAAATHLLARGGFALQLRLPDGGQVEARKPADLPPGPFTLFTAAKEDVAVPFGDADLRRLAALTGLAGLYVHGHQLTDAGLRPLAYLKGTLADLNLAHGRFGDDGAKVLGELTGLRGLYLGGNAVTDAGLGHLAGLKGLKTLGLQGTGVTADGVKRLAAARPDLAIVWDGGAIEPAKKP